MTLQDLNKFVINLPSRPDRLERINNELLYLFNDNHFVTINGIEGPDVKLSIAQAHMKAIQWAKDAKLPYALIMEDDCIFPAKYKTRQHVEPCLSNLPDNWNVLLGGVYEGDLDKYNEYWSKVGQFCALHFYIVNANCYDRLLAYDGVHHFDRFVNFNNDLQCYVASKMFAIQSDGYSNNAGKNVKYERFLKGYDVLSNR